MRRFNPEKELKKIQHGGRNKTIAFVILLLVVSVVSYSFALYQVRYSKRIIYTKVGPFSSKDIQLAVKVEGEEGSLDYFPPKEDGYTYSKTECDNPDVTEVEWKEAEWKLNLLTSGPNKCVVYFNPPVKYTITAEVIGGNGSVTPSTQYVIKDRDSQEIKIIPEKGYGVDNISCDNSQIISRDVSKDGNLFYLKNVTNNSNCKITLVKGFIITAHVDENGNVSPTWLFVKPNASSGKFTFKPSSDHYIKDVTCTNNQTARMDGNTFYVSNVTNDSDCNITLSNEYHTVTFAYTNSDTECSGTKSAKVKVYGDTYVSFASNSICVVTSHSSCPAFVKSDSFNRGAYLRATSDSTCNLTVKRGCRIDTFGKAFDVSPSSFSYNPVGTKYTLTPRTGTPITKITCDTGVYTKFPATVTCNPTGGKTSVYCTAE